MFNELDVAAEVALETFKLCEAFCEVATDAVADTPLKVALAAVELPVEIFSELDVAAEVAPEAFNPADTEADWAVEASSPAESALDDAVAA